MKIDRQFLLKHHQYILLTLICLIGVFLRFYQLGSVPVSLYWDEVAMLADAKIVSQTGKDLHGNSWLQTMFPSYGDYKLPMYIWLSAPMVKLFGASNFSIRVLNAVVGTTQILVIFFLIKRLLTNFVPKTKLIQKYAPLAGAFLLAITPWSFMFSRTGFEGFLGQFFLSVSVLIIMCDGYRIRNWMLSSMIGAAAVYSYYSVRFIWPVVVLMIFFYFITQKSDKKKRLIFSIIAAVILWMLMITPLRLSPYYQPSQQFRLDTASILRNDKQVLTSNQYREMTGNGPVSRVLYHRHLLTAYELAKNYSNHLDLGYLFFEGDDNLRHGTRRAGLIFSVFLPFLFVGVYSLAKHDFRAGLILGTWWLIALLPAAVPYGAPHALRSLNALIPVVIFIAIGLATSLSLLSQYSYALKTSVIILIFLIGIGQFSTFLIDYFGFYPTRSAPEWQVGYTQLAKRIDILRHEHPSVKIEISDDRFFLWVLAFGTFTPEQILSHPTQGYAFRSIDNVHFKVDNLLTNYNPTPNELIVAKANKLPGQPKHVESVSDYDGTALFEIGFY